MNILTFDIEEWYIEKILYGKRDFRYKQFDEALTKTLAELDKCNTKATFFCVGKLATDFPQVIRDISKHGHEIGCHSNVHTWLNKMTEEQLKQDTTEAIKALEDVSGQKVSSYRAPAFSVTTENKWAVRVLAECGIENDASIFPTDRNLGGYRGFPQDTPCLVNYEGVSLKEYPISLTSLLGKQIAYSGGGYFRILPYWFVNRTIKKRDYNICYFHLNDLIEQKLAWKSKADFEEYYKEPGTLKNRIVRYAKNNVGRGDAFAKLQKVLSENMFVSIQEADKIIDWEKVNNISL